MNQEFFKLHTYSIPYWAKDLKNIPRRFVKISNFNTPIHKWPLQGKPNGCEIYIKRDDLTGTELCGNKLRSLQFFFADILEGGAKHVVTGGGFQSGQCRAVAILCRLLGVEPHIVCSCYETDDPIERHGYPAKGNALLTKLCNAHVYTRHFTDMTKFKEDVVQLTKLIGDHVSEPCYCIPPGSSTVLGTFGYIELFEELMQQGLHQNFDDIVVGVASGSTLAGLAVGNFLTGSKVKIHGISVMQTKSQIYEAVDNLCKNLGINGVNVEDMIDVTDAYVGERYGLASHEVREFIRLTCGTTGIYLDPVFTGKAALGMVNELKLNPERFNGGIFELFNEEMATIAENNNNMIHWKNSQRSPFDN